MTFKERLEIEHPECVDDDLHAGCMGCPYGYGYESREQSHANCEDTCRKCWNREIPVDEFKPGDKVRLRKGLKIGCRYDGIVLLRGMDFKCNGEIVRKNIYGSYDVRFSPLLPTYMYSSVMFEKVEEREEGKMKFKLGDKVRTTKLMDYAGNELFPVGTIGRVTHVSISEREKLPYRIESNSNTYWYSEDMLKKAEFTKKDLEDGMLCETRDGWRWFWINGKLRSIDACCSVTKENFDGHSSNTLDIVKVGYPNENAHTIKDMLKMGFDEIIWERKEEPVTKDVSLEELNAILKEKFPDVDKFNLPIEE